jgi:hypothetical protein
MKEIMDGLDIRIARSFLLAMRDHTLGIWTAYVTLGYSLFFFFFLISLQNKVQMLLKIELLFFKHTTFHFTAIYQENGATQYPLYRTNFSTTFEACGLLTVTNF